MYPKLPYNTYLCNYVPVSKATCKQINRYGCLPENCVSVNLQKSVVHRLLVSSLICVTLCNLHHTPNLHNRSTLALKVNACTICRNLAYSLCSQGSHPDAADRGWWLHSTRLHPPVDPHQPPGGTITEQLQ